MGKIEHYVNTDEMGECFYAWLHMISDENVSVKFFQKSEKDDFPFPITSAMKFHKKIAVGGKSGTLQKINLNLTTNGDNLSDLIVTTLQDSLSIGENLPTYIEQKLNKFLTKPEDRAAIIHIRHKDPDDGRNLDIHEYKSIVRNLCDNGFNKFILIGDLAKCSYIQNKMDHDICILDYINPSKHGECKNAILEWGDSQQDPATQNPYFLARQILLIHMIYKKFEHVQLLIGRKSGAGLDMHAYAGIPTIFLDDDKYNSRYAPKDDWTNPYLSNLIPIFCPSNNGVKFTTVQKGSSSVDKNVLSVSSSSATFFSQNPNFLQSAVNKALNLEPICNQQLSAKI